MSSLYLAVLATIIGGVIGTLADAGWSLRALSPRLFLPYFLFAGLICSVLYYAFNYPFE